MGWKIHEQYTIEPFGACRNCRSYDTYITNAGLSGGELKKLSLTRMLLMDRPVVVLDEPFAHLDVVGQELLVKLIQEIKTEKIIILVTHDKRFVEFADRVVHLSEGRVCNEK